MLAEIRQLLRETTAADSFWTDAELLAYWNQAMDLRVMDLAEAHEGWVTDIVDADTVQGQTEYTLPEGTGRVKRLLWVTGQGNQTVYTPMIRDERWNSSLVQDSTAFGTGSIPAYRLVGELILLEPAPATSRTNGIRIEVESAPARFTTGTDELAQRFPDIMETLLIYDTWDIALGVEDAQGNIDPSAQGRLKKFHQKYEGRFINFIETRTFGKVFAQPFYLGD
jgi:hypothetical protein